MAKFAFANYRTVESGSAAPAEEFDYIFAIEFHSQFVTGLPWLTYLQDDAPDLVAVSNADLLLNEAFRRQVFTKRTPGEFGPEAFFPEWVMLRRLSVNSLFRAAVNSQVGLSVAFQIAFEGLDPA